MNQSKSYTQVSSRPADDIIHEASPPHKEEAEFLGFRGLLAIQTVLYIIFQIFFPAVVVHSPNDTGAKWAIVLRKSFSVFLWNPSLIRASFIILSARTNALPFLQNPTSLTLASALFRRPIRLLVPLAIAIAVAIPYNKTGSIDHIKNLTHNVSLPSPYVLPTGLPYFNSVYTLFWTVRDYADQAGSQAFYNDSLWTISVIFQQSYTVYLAAAIIPYTRAKWRLPAWILFILTAWWVQSWAWYSISGLLLADATMNMRLRERLVRGIKFRLGKWQWKLATRVPGWVFGVFLLLAGGTLQYFWVEWRPDFGSQSAVAQPQARDDDYLVVMGIMLLLESVKWLRNMVGNKFFVAIGRRSLSK